MFGGTHLPTLCKSSDWDFSWFSSSSLHNFIFYPIPSSAACIKLNIRIPRELVETDFRALPRNSNSLGLGWGLFYREFQCLGTWAAAAPVACNCRCVLQRYSITVTSKFVRITERDPKNAFLKQYHEVKLHTQCDEICHFWRIHNKDSLGLWDLCSVCLPLLGLYGSLLVGFIAWCQLQKSQEQQEKKLSYSVTATSLRNSQHFPSPQF